MLKKVISGGQRGVDQAALFAASKLEIETGGWAPKGYMTLDGPKSGLAKMGLVEHTASHYPPRTYANVKDSDGTIRLAYDFTTAGELCTLKAIKKYNRPYYDIDLNDPDFIFDVTNWIQKNNIEIINIAGNAGKTLKESKIIFKRASSYLYKVFRGVI